jgi:hypothetical protein
MDQSEPNRDGLDAEHHVIAGATPGDGRDGQARQFMAVSNLGLRLSFQSRPQC